MNKILKTVSAFLLAISMAAIPATAQPDHNTGRQSHFSSSQSNRGGGHNSRPSGGNNGGQSRPGNTGNTGRPGGNGSGHRPGGNNNGHRPGSTPGNNRPDNNHRPGGNPGHNRPGNGHRPGDNHRPGNNHRPGGNPGHNHRPSDNHRPGNGHRPGRPTPPPPRPHRPVNFGSGHHAHHVPFFGSYRRPLPPPSWRPAVYHGPSFGTILGIAFGTTVDMTLRTLLNQGYNVTSYGNNVVYLTNVPQMNYYWPDAALYYNNGALCGSTFTYPTAYYDMSRYNALYNTFCSQYGVPVSTVKQGGVISATWFGNGNRYVTLEFNSNYGDYYTTLSFGM